MSRVFEQKQHPHQPRNVNHVHAAEQAAAGFNTVLAVLLTRSVGTMFTAYAFLLLALLGLFGLLGWLNPFVFLLATWISQQFLQLVLLPIIMVGQNVLDRKAELQADEAYATTIKTYHELEQVSAHLNAQDTVLVRIQAILERLEAKV
jgi:uncharacterized membrane protein